MYVCFLFGWTPQLRLGGSLFTSAFQFVKLDLPSQVEVWTALNLTKLPDAEAKAPILWPPDAKSWLIGKDSDAGKDWGQKEKRVIEDEMVGWHHWLSGHELSKLQVIVKDREAWSASVHGVAKISTWLSDWTTTDDWSSMNEIRILLAQKEITVVWVSARIRPLDINWYLISFGDYQ